MSVTPHATDIHAEDIHPTAVPLPAQDLVELLTRHARTRPDHTALVHLGPDGTEVARLSYGQLHEEACDLAVRLGGIAAPGERALLAYPDSRHFASALFGCLYAGLVAVPVPLPTVPLPTGPASGGRASARTASVIEDCAPELVLTAGSEEYDLAGHFGGNVPVLDTSQRLGAPVGRWQGYRPSPDDVALLQYTSGSTSVPRGVRLTHRNFIGNLTDILAAQGVGELADPAHFVTVSWLPHFHDMGLAQILAPLSAGGSSVQMSPTAFLRKPAAWLRAITRYRGYSASAPNFGYDRCVDRVTDAEKAELDLTHWRVALNGAEPVRPGTLARFLAAFEPCGLAPAALSPSYGLAESTVYVSGFRAPWDPLTLTVSARAADEDKRVVTDPDPADARVYVGCGRWPGSTRLVVVDPSTGGECPADGIGEIWIRGAGVSGGYWRQDEASGDKFRATLAGDTSGETFLRTGDLGFVHEGQLFVIGRRDSVMVVNGRNHHAEDIEQTVTASHPAVAVGGTAAFLAETEGAGPERAGPEGTGPAVVVVAELRREALAALSPAGDPAGLRAEVTAAVQAKVFAEHQVAVTRVELLLPGGLPRTTSGKVQRAVCHRMWRDGGLRRWRCEE
ncbi:fatty acyl-AMP ligase [Streptomyces sp. NPDC046915]|uniref:fatty acyl-AMP ligase n=1 Tax=Streptomyces sp. NPDC046915 TaxID=3155257 RepID=UPI0033BFBEEA